MKLDLHISADSPSELASILAALGAGSAIATAAPAEETKPRQTRKAKEEPANPTPTPTADTAAAAGGSTPSPISEPASASTNETPATSTAPSAEPQAQQPTAAGSAAVVQPDEASLKKAAMDYSGKAGPDALRQLFIEMGAPAEGPKFSTVPQGNWPQMAARLTELLGA